MSGKKVNILKGFFIPVVIIIILITGYPCYGQNINLKSYTAKDGLSNNQVRAIAADSTGYLWIATWDGICRFDGYEFRNYYHIPGDTSSLPYFAIRDICVDGAGEVWASTETGHLLKYDRTADKFEKISEFSTRTQKMPVIFLDTDGVGNLWVLMPDSIIKRDCHTGKTDKYIITEKDLKPISLPISGNQLYVEKDDLIWLSAGGYLYRLRKAELLKTEVMALIIEEEFRVRSVNNVVQFDYYFTPWSKFYITPEGGRWLFSYSGLYRQDNDGVFREFTGKLSDFNFSPDEMYVWGDPGGVCHVYDPRTKNEYRIITGDLRNIMTFHVQNRNLIWFAGINDFLGYSGLIKAIISPDFFKNYRDESGIENSEAVYGIYKDRQDNIWTGIRGRDHIHLIGPDGKWSSRGKLSPEMALKAGYLRAIKGTESGIWLGYFFEVLMFYDLRSERITSHFPDAELCFTILPWSDGTLFIGSDDMLIKYNRADGTSEIFTGPLGEARNFYTLSHDKKGNIWGGLSGSQVIRINTSDRGYQIIKLSDDSYNVESICLGDNNDLWAALLGGGVCNYNLSTGVKKFYTTSNGLSNNTTYSIFKDSSGFIWVSTNSGISRINPRTGMIRVFDSSDGQNIIEFNSDALFASEDGEVLLGGVGGIVSFYPDLIDRMDTINSKQKILITEFRSSGEKVTSYLSDTILLAKGNNNFQITFSSTDFANSEKTSYRYMLSGIDKKWIETTWKKRSVSYSNLTPGWHSFHIQATDRNGHWSAYKELKIRLQPYFYQTKFFRISAPLLFIAILGMILTGYVLHVRQRERMKQDELRLNALRGQMNPHFIFNSLNSINYFISKNDKLSSNSYIADFSRLIRSILANLDRNYVPFEAELNSLIDYIRIEHLRFGDKFDYNVATEEIIRYNNLEVLPGLIQPFIENAIWHGIRSLEKRKGFLSVRFKLPENDSIKCLIEDDGIGRSMASEMRIPDGNHISKGISIVAERLKLISKLMGKNFEFEITDLYPEREETGTRVLIEIPFRRI